jgi:hypothetical protein
MSSSEGNDSALLRTQFSNPSDILSLLLIVGSDIVQKALAQFVGVRPFKWAPDISLTPVAFSFGWVAYAFMSLMSVAGDERLMPDTPDCPSILINCENAYIRTNNSWVLGRILRDYEDKLLKKANYSMRIDIFTATQVKDIRSSIDYKWIFGWLVILVQQVIAFIPWILYGDWAIFMVTAAGTIFALIYGSLPQWSAEKWSTREIRDGKKKIVCLTRGNGHRHALVLICKGPMWDLEAMASAVPSERRGTRSISLILTIGWTLLLITVSGLKQNTWFLIGVGGMGMLQNYFAAGRPRTPAAFGFHLEPYNPVETIIGYRENPKDKAIDADNSDEEEDAPNDQNTPSVVMTRLPHNVREGPGVMGALMALEDEMKGAGAALATVFFPGGIKYEPERYRFNREKKYWKKAFRRMGRPVQQYPRRLNENPPTEVNVI